MDGYLSQLSDHLAPSEEYISRCNQVLNNVAEKLKQNSKFSIDRIRPEGGAEKKTSLSYSLDYDVVAFVNKVEPPFKDNVLSDFQDILMRHFDVKEEDIKLTLFSIQFQLEGVDFDLLVATNMTRGLPGPAWKAQHTNMLDKIRESGNPQQAATMNSSGLTEAAVEFVKQQTPFVHKVARLAKYWNSTIFFTKSLSGRSSIFELLGIDAGREEERVNPHQPSILRAFRLFLDRVRNINSLKIWYDAFYSKSQIPRRIFDQVPLLLDPSNPYNNFMYPFTKEAKALFSESAEESLRRLERVETQVRMYHGYPDFRSLFLPQPKPVQVGPTIRLPTPSKWMVGTYQRDRYLQPNLIVRKDELGNDKFVLGHIKKFMSAFMVVCELEASHVQKDQATFAKEKAQELIDSEFGTEGQWTSTSERHEDRNITFEVPVGRDGRNVLRASCNLE